MSGKGAPGVELTPLQQALLTIERLQEKLAVATRAEDEPIAIIGMGCRFPGGASDPERFQALLWSGREAVGEVPSERRDLRAAHDPEPSVPGRTTMRRGGFVEGVDRFDAEFFRISRREAEGMDPQQRFFLEVGWEALEDAGLSPRRLSGTRTGVFAGVHARDYALLAEGGLERVGAHYSTGVDASYVAGRLSYLLGLHGPSMAVDTACSSSLVAVHLACQSLRSGESTVALAGGVKLLLAPHLSVFLAKAGALSPSQRCRAFDRDADGMVQGEGCGVVVLKRRRDALRDGDRILATLLATSTNHDGASGGLTVPNVRAQEALYRLALQRAGIDPAQVDYLEAHGTGTRLGDPIELQGVARVYGGSRPPERPLWVGSVKPNIGHAEAAAGIAGLIKAVQVLRAAEVPPALHFEHPTPEFSWDGSGIAVARERTALAPRDRPLRAAVSSFGMSGVNAHALVEAHPDDAPVLREEGPFLLPLSARREQALRELAREWLRQLSEDRAVALRDASFTAGVGRAHHEQRWAFVARSREELCALLRRAVEARAGEGLFQGQVRGTSGPGVVLALGDCASPLESRVLALLEREPRFLQQFSALDARFEKVAGWSVARRLREPRETEREVGDTRWRQALGLLWQLALVELWQAHGVEVAAVAGDGVGAWTAAVVAGGLTMEAAVGRVLALAPEEPVVDKPARLPRFSFEEERWLEPGGAGPSGGLDDERPSVAEGEGTRWADRIVERGGVVLALGDAPDWGVELTSAARRMGTETTVVDAAPPHDQDVRHALLGSAARLYCAGVTPRFESLLPPGRKVHAPTYPWQRERYWWDGRRESPGEPPGPTEPRRAPEGLFWDLVWRPGEARSLSSRLEGAWLVVATTTASAQALRERMTGAGGSVSVAVPGPFFERTSARDYQVDFSRSESFVRLLEDWGATAGATRGVVFLGDAPEVGPVEQDVSVAGPRELRVAVDAERRDSDVAVVRAVRHVSLGLTCLVQALVRVSLPIPPRLLLLTSRGQGEDAAVSLVGASLWGLGRVIAYEHPELGCRRIDVGDTSSGPSLDALVAELASSSPTEVEEDEVLLRRAERRVARLARSSLFPEEGAGFQPREDRTYLVTGGSGGIGLRLCSWLVERGARHLAICGRAGETPAARRALAPLRAAGAKVGVFQVDVGQRPALADLVATLRREGPPLGGVFHCAGVLADGALAQLSSEGFDTVMGPKVDGAWNLHALVTDPTVEHFVLFSSTASLLGSPGQGNDAAANGFLDGLARLRRSQGLPAVSLQWGSWGEVGMAAADARRGARLAELGLSPMPSEEALAAMAKALVCGAEVQGIARFDLARWRERHPAMASASLFRAALDMAPPSVEVAIAPRKLRDVLLSLEGRARAQALEARLKEMVGEVSRLSPERIALSDSFDALGFDSIMALELRDLVLGALDVGLPLNRFVDARSIAQVVEELLEKLALVQVLGGATSESAGTRRVLL
ncbi:type I polyketide synthase [Myxococcus sp. K15C18031901]|uniref:type I polyketide synthase n=1 Tax=Myxococcus dinghuensis TaxID=2906761 RepID=UPI0020A7CFC5|nr:type I polyketide synthase [Myxococcus dinghuensis]MCP3102821.1 type I polyketide synthase [Myxococcus dinghuensis]